MFAKHPSTPVTQPRESNPVRGAQANENVDTFTEEMFHFCREDYGIPKEIDAEVSANG